MDLPTLTQEPFLGLDATPDAEYPLRILKAYRARCDCKWEVHGLDKATMRTYDIMNEHQDQRAAILDEAIKTLEAVG